MRNDREYGHTDPHGRKDLVLAATNLFCTICDSRPCFLLATAATAVAQEQLTEGDGANLIGATRYVENLVRLQNCLSRHLEIAHEAWQLDNYFRVSKEALSALEKFGTEKKNGKSCEPDGGP